MIYGEMYSFYTLLFIDTEHQRRAVVNAELPHAVHFKQKFLFLGDKWIDYAIAHGHDYLSNQQLSGATKQQLKRGEFLLISNSS
jgi:hypothetical protein